ncbi:MAG: DNA-binding transcriptional regulator [Candidatus Roseilinea sp.]|nr:MAG: DNA-binding transcriptional regulator [Candidatus Roseilinea sp.]
MSRAYTRAERLNEMKRLYVQQAFSDIEMSKRLGVDRTTVFRDRLVLEAAYPFIEVEPGRWKIDRTRLLSEIRLSIDEALPLYLAARRLSRQTRFAQKHIATAIEKLATCLHQPMTARLVRAANDILRQEQRPERLSIIEIITRAWVEQRKARITYRALRAGRPLIHTIHPSLWGESAYVIAYTEITGDIVPFKIERIEDAVITGETFTLPDAFDDQALLRYAWGIWIGDGEPVTVRLRFAPGKATRRVQETRWHPSQQITLLEDGGCEWRADVAEPLEMLPWIRGWGADVEVLEPKALRETLMGEAKAMAELYGWRVSSSPTDKRSTTLDDFFGG